MRRRFLFSLVALVVVTLSTASSVAARAAETKYELKVVTDRPEAIYSQGETAKFFVTLKKDGSPVTEGEVVYQIDKGGMPPATKGKLALTGQPVGLEGKLDEPGFLLCTVRYMVGDRQVAEALAGAGFDPQKIAPSMPVPEDFNAFWTRQKDRLKAMPMDPKLTPVRYRVPGVECFDVKVACVPPRPVAGYYARPIGAAAKSLPAIVFIPGAGVATANLHRAAASAKKFNAICLDINVHGIDNGKSNQHYKALADGELKDYWLSDRDDREKCYFVGMFLRVVRALDFVASQPEWDGKTLIVEGDSQGGGLSIAAAGLDNRVTLIAVAVPAFDDQSARCIGRIDAWPRMVRFADGKPDPKSLEAARYFDSTNFAAQAKAEAYFSVGFVDPHCPPSAVYATFSNYGGKKHILAEPLMGHGSTPKVDKAFNDAVADHIAKMKGKN